MYQFLELPNLEKYYSENPGSVIFAFLAFRNLEQGNAERALSICEQGVEKYPQYPFGHFVLGLCHYHLKDYSKAKTHLEISTAYDDKNPQAWKLLGEINEHLDLSLQSEECNLNYYLLDSFNPDALEKYQKEELIDFNAFRTDFSPEEMPPAEVREDSEAPEGESRMGTFFKSPKEEDEDLDLPEGGFEEPLEEASDTKKDEGVVPEERRTGDGMEEDATKKSELESESELSEFGQDEKLDTGEEESLSTDEEREMSGEVDKTELEQSDDLLDFRSVVRDIISEDQDDTSENLEEEPEQPRDVEPRSESPVETEASDKQTERPPILTPTIGEIYIAQGRFDEAVDVFEQLLKKEPENQRYQKKIKDVKAIIDKQKLRSMGD